jgi:hypothetical protein
MRATPHLDRRLDGSRKGIGSVAGIRGATTHFTPSLEVKILGITEEEQDRLSREAKSTPPSNMVGRWIASEKTGLPGIITITKDNDAFYKIYKFKDGSEGRYEVIVQNVNGQVRYREKQSKTSDYLLILPNGDLGHCDEEGTWATSKKTR